MTRDVSPKPSFLRVFLSSPLAFVFPPATRLWSRASMLQAWLIAIFNTIAGGLWFFGFLITLNYMTPVGARAVRPSFWAVGGQVFGEFSRQWENLALMDRSASIVSFVVFIAVAYVVPGFMILPFATRPGPNRPCVRHVARTILLGSGLAHWWGIVFCGIALLRKTSVHDDYAVGISNYLLAGSLLVVWQLFVLIHAARRDYRGPDDKVPVRDPGCDACGYNLVASEPEGRCPECGRPVVESLGPDSRLPTAWEQRPSVFNVRVILHQLRQIVTSPRGLFFSMPMGTGQQAAQRWLVGSIVAVGMLASTMVPILYWVIGAEWNSVAITGAMAMGVTWSLFAMMMVGIETAGIATFSRMRSRAANSEGVAAVPLSAASKVTSYSAILMLAWVLLGGLQLVTLIYLNDLAGQNALHRWLGISRRSLQIYVAISMAVAHIGGLLWFELTVYRGIRAIQFANK